MTKKKILKKQEFTLADIPKYNIPNEKELTIFNPDEFFKDDKEVAQALFQCLLDNDSETYMEILDSYLRVNRSKVAKKAALSRSTVSLALSKKGNPTLKTIAKIVHEAAVRK